MADLASASHCSKQTIVALEHGRQVPRISTAVAIAHALGVTPEIAFPDAFTTHARLHESEKGGTVADALAS